MLASVAGQLLGESEMARVYQVKKDTNQTSRSELELAEIGMVVTTNTVWCVVGAENRGKQGPVRSQMRSSQ